MTEAAGHVLEARGLTRHFDDGERVIDVLCSLDLALGASESVAVVGESGVGKSTLLHLLGALDRPDGGVVHIDGESIFELSTAELSRIRGVKVSFIFQFHHLLGDFDAVENVMMPLLIAGEGRAAARRRASRVLERVGMAERLSHRPGQLSGGEQQRVAVARAVVVEPRVILADEPTGNLDPATAADVQSLLVELQRESGCAMVVATHNRVLAASMGRTLRLADGVLSAEVSE